MRNGIIRFLFVLAALLAGVDTPGMASYDVPVDVMGIHSHEFVETSDAKGSDDSKPVGSGSELPHHHHCPAGLIADEFAVLPPGKYARDGHIMRATIAPASRATAPPTQPPAA